MPNGVIELPLRHNGRASYTKNKLCLIPCISLIFLLAYTFIALSEVGGINDIQQKSEPFRSNYYVVNNGTYGTIKPAWDMSHA